MATIKATVLDAYAKHVSYVDESTNEEVTYDYVSLLVADKKRIAVYDYQLRAMIPIKAKAALAAVGLEKFAIALNNASVEYTETKVKDASGEKVKHEIKSLTINDELGLIDKWFEKFLG